jgi:hypothetical protein
MKLAAVPAGAAIVSAACTSETARATERKEHRALRAHAFIGADGTGATARRTMRCGVRTPS